MNSPSFTLLVALNAISKFGDTLLTLALPFLYLQSTGDAGLALAALSFRALPYLIAPFLGELADRFETRTVYFWAQVVQAVFIGLLPWALHHPALGLLLLTLSGIGSVLAGLLNYYKLIPRLVPAEDLERAIGVFTSASDTAKLLGPLVGGVLLGLLGARMALYLDALTFLLSAVGVSLIVPASQVTAQGASSVWTSLQEGFQYFKQSAEMKALALTMSLANLGVGVLTSMMVTFFADVESLHANTVGALVAAAGVAGLLGSRFTHKILPGRPLTQRVLLWQVVSLVASLLLVLPWTAMRVLGFCVLTFAMSASNVITIAYRQQTIPERLQGRVNANIRLFITGALPVSGLLFAWLTRQFGLPVSLLGVPVCCLLALGAWGWHVRQINASRAQADVRV